MDQRADATSRPPLEASDANEAVRCAAWPRLARSIEVLRTEEIVYTQTIACLEIPTLTSQTIYSLPSFGPFLFHNEE
jgi:hypothetical protein